jgi:hypothetical protein
MERVHPLFLAWDQVFHPFLTVVAGLFAYQPPTLCVLSFKKSEEWMEPEQNALRMMAMGTGHT